MKNGNDELVKLLDDAMRDADWLELQLPHIADRTRTLVKLIKSYDKNQKAFLSYYIKTSRRAKVWKKCLDLMATYLNRDQLIFMHNYTKELQELYHDTE